MTFAEVAVTAGYVVAIGGAIAAIFGGGKWMIGTLKKVNEFLEDWRGEDARPGYPGRPGVLQRLVDLEDKVRTIEHESVPNSGSSMKDAVNRIDKSLPEFLARMAALESRIPVAPAQDGTQPYGDPYVRPV